MDTIIVSVGKPEGHFQTCSSRKGEYFEDNFLLLLCKKKMSSEYTVESISVSTCKIYFCANIIKIILNFKHSCHLHHKNMPV